MRTLSTELSAWIDEVATGPTRVYADANVPAGLVSFMRLELHWDVFFVMEQADLRRAPDIEHYRLARQMHRTLITLDHDYLDDRRFPPAESGGVIVLSAPDEQQLARLLRRIDRTFFRTPDRSAKAPGWSAEASAGRIPDLTATASNPDAPGHAPLAGRKLVVHPEIAEPSRGRSRRRRR